MSLPLEKQLGNLEEVKPLRRTGWEEAPLVAFTLLAQAAVGGFWAINLIFASLWGQLQPDSPWLRLLPVLAVGACLGLSMLASFSHLGTKHNAWRAVLHLKKSWLSREILFSLLFGAAWLAVALSGLFLPRSPALLAALGSVLGLGLLYSMAQVYHLRAVPAWNTWRTDVGFLISTLLLGPLMMSFILSYEAGATGISLTRLEWAEIGAWSLLFLLARLLFPAGHASHPLAVRLWRAFMWLSILAVVVVYFMPAMLAWWAPLIVFLLVLIPEIINRWLFYEGRQ
jgi:anaerobic dimethyl sulfoxide reductase subunit C (anchor subunit)